jgi:hypothetical protein
MLPPIEARPDGEGEDCPWVVQRLRMTLIDTGGWHCLDENEVGRNERRRRSRTWDRLAGRVPAIAKGLIPTGLMRRLLFPRVVRGEWLGAILHGSWSLRREGPT